MKILYISNSRIPTEKAHGIQIIKMCEAFSNAGADLRLVLPIRNNKQFKNVNPFEYYEVKKNFKIIKLKCLDPSFLISRVQGIYIKFQILFFIISLLLYLSGLTRMKMRTNAEILYTLYTRDEYLLPLLQKFSKYAVWEAHTLPKNKKHYLKYWQRCKKIIAISQGLKDELVRLGVDENKIIVAPDGVDLKNYELRIKNQELRKKLGLPLDKKIILYTGHFYKWKGVQVLADAAKKLPEYFFVFIGGGDHKFEGFKQKNKRDNILYTGYKKPEEIPYYLKSADVLVLPNSLKDAKSKYTSPLKLFEYMASGVPIIAADLPVIKEILNNENAIFFQPDNLQDLADKIKILLQNKELADKISTQALRDVQQYTWQKRVGKIIKFII